MSSRAHTHADEEAVRTRLAEADLRLTASRRRVLAVLAAARRPVTLPEMLALEPRLSQSSAYRNLAEMIDAGVVHRIDIGEEHGRYELSDELTTHHHHLVCTACGRVLDVDLGPEIEQVVDRAAERLRRHGDVEVTGHRIDLLGRCADCRGRPPVSAVTAP